MRCVSPLHSDGTTMLRYARRHHVCVPVKEKEEFTVLSVKEKFKNNPLLYYALSICATWAGIGSLMNGVVMTQKLGIIPSLIWVLGNTVACILFGYLALRIPKAREVFRSKAMLWICGIMCVFQSWLGMNGMQAVFRNNLLELVPDIGVAVYGWLTLFKAAVSIITLIAGVVLFMQRKDGNAVTLARERLGKALLFMPIGVIGFVVGLPFCLALLSTAINGVLISPYPLIGLPLLYFAARLTEKKISDPKTSDILWWIVFVLAAAAAAVTAFMIFVVYRG